MKRTKGEIEAEISKAITQWEKDFLGRGSLSVKSDILRDMVIISLQGILTPAEAYLTFLNMLFQIILKFEYDNTFTCNCT